MYGASTVQDGPLTREAIPTEDKDDERQDGTYQPDQRYSESRDHGGLRYLTRTFLYKVNMQNK